LLKGDDLLPDIAIVDPQFTVTAPPSVTAATGMDALTHAIEAYISVKASPMIRPYALDSIKRIFAFLPIAYSNGEDMKAREKMAIAACQAGICINNSSVTVVHGMSRPIGAIFHVPHGISNAMLLAGCMKRIKEECVGVLAEIAITAGFADKNDDERKAAGLLIDQLLQLSENLGIPKLRDYGITKDDFYKNIPVMAKAAIASGSPANLPIVLSQQEIEQLYQSIWEE
jgi:alcohol dehydrogenase class IV